MSALPAIMREIEAYETIRETCHVLGYRLHHQRSTRNGTPITGDAGFPDFVIVNPWPGRGVRFVEIKRDESGALTPEQAAWGAQLVQAGARWNVVWVPSGLDAFVQELVDESRLR